MTLMDRISRKINAALEKLFKSELARRSAQNGEAEGEKSYEDTQRYSGVEDSKAPGRAAGPRAVADQRANVFRPRRPAS